MHFNFSQDEFTSGKWDHKSDLHLQLAVKSYSNSQVHVYPMTSCIMITEFPEKKRSLLLKIRKKKPSPFLLRTKHDVVTVTHASGKCRFRTESVTSFTRLLTVNRNSLHNELPIA